MSGYPNHGGAPPGFNPNAPSFSPNPNGPVFVPGVGLTYPQQQPTPQQVQWQQQQQYQQQMMMQQQHQYQQMGGYGQPPPQQMSGQSQRPQPVHQPSAPRPVEQTKGDAPVAKAPPSGKPVVVSVRNDARTNEPKVEKLPKKEKDSSPPKVDKVKKEKTPKPADDDDWECADEDVQPSTAKAVKQPPPPVDDGKPRKEHVNVVFIGHVDAGKSTIGGHIMFLTGMVDQRTKEKYMKEAKELNRESWYLSWALDTNQEERDKGKTVECGRAFFETEKKHFTILDAPGHKSFVPNMIGGASQADLAVLVISARKGEFETGFDRGGQTSEHAMLARTVGVKRMIILVNKMDDPTVMWKQERFDEIQGKLTPYLKKLGFNPKTDLQYIPCSGLTGAYLKNKPEGGEGSWYKGETLIDFLDAMAPCRDIELLRKAAVRCVIGDKYSDMGTVAIGKVDSGTIQRNQTLLMMPNKTQVQVVQLWSDDVEKDDVGPGESIKVKLKNVEEEDILPGFTLCSLDAPCKVGRIFDATVVILEHKSIICPGYTCVLHIHSAVEEVTVTHLICMVQRGERIPGRPRFVKEGHQCVMRLESQEMFCLDTFKEFEQMGRVMLRDEGKTIAIGKVLKVIE